MTLARIVQVDPNHVKDEVLREAAQVVKGGGLVIIPTETVYGVAANMLDSKAVERLMQIKERPKDKHFSLHIADKQRIEEFAADIPVAAYKIMEKFWPGPLTMVLRSSQSGTIGLRMPDNAIALSIITHAGVPVICPSANLSGRQPPVSFQEAIIDLKDKVDLAIDAGTTRLKKESTVVDLSAGSLKILREGAVPGPEIERAVNAKQVLFVCTGNSCRSVMAEFYLRKLLHDKGRTDVRVTSAGILLLSGLGVSHGAREVLAEEGIDASGHFSQRITKEMAKSSDLILVMEKMHEDAVLKIAPDAKNRLFLLKEFAKIEDGHLDITDPIGRPIDFYQKTFAVIKEAVEKVSNLI